MFAVVLRITILIGVLFAIYAAVDWYMRRDRLRMLDEEYANGEGGPLTREDYVTKGLLQYDRSWQRKLLYGIFLIPMLIALLLAVVANYG